jgi:hypothetical protein
MKAAARCPTCGMFSPLHDPDDARCLRHQLDAVLTQLAASEAARQRAVAALRGAFPVGSWCAYCGQEIDAPEARPCPRCSAARRALSADEPGTGGGTTP